MSEEALPESDRAEGTPHPRYAPRLIGHAAAAGALAAAIGTGRMHHAWLLTGPEGIGKATLAWQAARALLAPAAAGGEGLATDPAHPALAPVLALAAPGLCLLRRPWDPKRKAFATQIPVDSIRQLNRFFALSRPDGGARVVIVDPVDDLNASAANALLKRLEEPPPQTVFLLVCHRPSAVLATIRSRCRTLPLAPLGAGETAEALRLTLPELGPDEAGALAGLAGGSVGMAAQLHAHDGVGLDAALRGLLAQMPGLDRGAAHGLAASLAARGAEDRRDLAIRLTAGLLADLARAGVARGPETLPPTLARLSPDPRAARLWAETCHAAEARLRRGLALNLDPHSLILDMWLDIDRTARDCVGSQHMPAS